MRAKKDRNRPPLRTREHYIASLSQNHVERIILRSGHTAEVPHNDYGYDLVVSTYNYKGDPDYRTGEFENGVIYLQIKATDTLRVLKDGATICCPVSRGHVDLWCKKPMPVIFVVYDARTDKAYWLYVQEYFKLHSPGAGSTGMASLRLSKNNVLDTDAVEKFRQYKTEVLTRIGQEVDLH